jgi:2-oxoglutarate/2-oxoacid ferredoxin oxidoreductase subunit alpha
MTQAPAYADILDPELSRAQLMDEITIKFAGDSGDGIQLAGLKFAQLASAAGEAVRTMPDFPAEIRSPAGSLGGVSGFQVRTGRTGIHTAGDRLDLLVAMNPAALRTNVGALKPGGILLVNDSAFTTQNLAKADYADNPLEDGSLRAFRVFPVPIGKLTRGALRGLPLSTKETDRSRNFFALGLICWLFPRPDARVEDWIAERFASTPDLAEANRRAFTAGWNYGETAEYFASPLTIGVASQQMRETGVYRFVNGNSALARGLVMAARRAGVGLFLGGYPITPATEVMQELSRYRPPEVRMFQAEDEIAAIGSAIGASFAGALGATSTSGPGLSLMGEFIDLAVMAELPLVVINVQRAGPSTGIPTKSEQADLLQALYGRHGESPLPVLAAATPKDCFDTVVEASRIALRYMTPVIVLSDLTLASGAEVWREPELDDLPVIETRRVAAVADLPFQPYRRDPDTLARPWAIPGTPALEHVIGGLEKAGESGAVCYEPENHETMIRLRQDKIAGIARDYPATTVFGADDAPLLLLGWGSTQGPIREATEQLQAAGHAVACLQLRHLNPLPSDLGALLRRHRSVVVIENNSGQLWQRLRSEYLLDLQRLNKVQGTAFRVAEIVAFAESLLEPSA